MRNITKVPNGPLIKKKGPFKGSTLKSGGVIKKAQVGDTITVKKPTWQKMTQAQRAAIKTQLGPEKFKIYKDSVSEDATNRREVILNRNANARGMTREQVRAQQEKDKKKPDAVKEDLIDCTKRTKKTGSCTDPNAQGGGDSTKDNKRNGGPIKRAQNGTSEYSDPKPLYDKIKKTKDSIDNAKIKLEERKYKAKVNYLNSKLKNEESIMNIKKGKKTKAKSGAMIKRADGSMSRRGLWDNIRANKGSGKKPTKQMLQQERKIKAKSKK